ncbi:polysaccharide deacetylase [Geomonas sp.]|uniref:polysaccharide deacetylase family protein n=1 Tax=Geomonas sp. TaxID=2651584 RepID=UPI002B48D796|nr:polysaccharide deacetylase [Geomonas sp.]HJV37046.1 polysaccharide deacetylase [Geomonas sp.]
MAITEIPEKGSARWAASLFFLLLILLQIILAGPCAAAEITDYRVIRQPMTDAAGGLRVAIRSFKSNGVPHLLVVDPVSLKTSDLPASALNPASTPPGAKLHSSPYLQAIETYTGAPYRLQNGGATRAQSAADGVFLTVDLCPSKRPFEYQLFEAVERLGQGSPVPVAICITGIWLINHPEELAYLKKQVAAGKLAITWVNHSYHHTYDPKAPLERNFVLTPGTDFMEEVLGLERELLAHDLVPSPFFRYPGLVSDAKTMRQLGLLSLIPIGADAWLAKGETPRDGSFILVHGNGNEPKGIKLVLPMLSGKELRLRPLPAAFIP